MLEKPKALLQLEKPILKHLVCKFKRLEDRRDSIESAIELIKKDIATFNCCVCDEILGAHFAKCSICGLASHVIHVDEFDSKNNTHKSCTWARFVDHEFITYCYTCAEENGMKKRLTNS